jgi:hypothetical protein
MLTANLSLALYDLFFVLIKWKVDISSDADRQPQFGAVWPVLRSYKRYTLVLTLTANLSLALYDLFSILANILIFTGPNLSETYRHQVTKIIFQGLQFYGYADCYALAP